MKLLLMFVGGFREDLPEQTGLAKLWQRLRRMYTDGAVYFHQRFEWKHKAKHIAEGMAKVWDGRAPIVIVAYSWGSPTASAVCNHLRKLAIPVDTVILCDPVYRFKGLPNWLWIAQVRAMLKWPKYLWFPDNVQNLRAVYQRKNRPWGRMPGVKGKPLQSNGWPARLREWTELDYKHTQIDESDYFADLVDLTIESIIEDTRGLEQ